jgi:hypothetical protein
MAKGRVPRRHLRAASTVDTAPMLDRVASEKQAAEIQPQLFYTAPPRRRRPCAPRIRLSPARVGYRLSSI